MKIDTNKNEKKKGSFVVVLKHKMIHNKLST